MASAQAASSGFFQLFRARCGLSDLGEINLNWFEELSREAVRLQPRLRDDEDDSEGRQDNNLFKTPQQKRPYHSQLESTPTIFREQRLCSPLFLSPARDQDKGQLTAENCRNVKTQQSPDPTVLTKNGFGTSSRDLADSPVIRKQLFKAPFRDIEQLQGTPQQDRKFDIGDSLLCTPQSIRIQTSRCISESLGVQADPDMSWSSSMATPPSPTVIIIQAKEEVSKPKTFNKSDMVIVQSLFSKVNAVPEADSLAPPNDVYKLANDGSKFAHTLITETMEKSLDYIKAQQKKTVLNAVGDEEACQVVEDAIEGMEDVLSIFFTNEKPSELRKVKIDRGIKRRNKRFSGVTGKNDCLIENRGEQSACSSAEKQSINNKFLQPKSCREISSSYEWTPLNLPDTAQEENVSAYVRDCNTENSACPDVQSHKDESAGKDFSETNGDGQDKGNKMKCEETLPYDNNKHLEGLASGAHTLSSVTHGHVLWKSDQKPKPILSTIKKQTKFLYILNMNDQQTESTERIDLTMRNKPSNDLETPDAQPARSLTLKNASSAKILPEVKQVIKEDDDDFKENSIDIQELEETFMDVTQTNSIAASVVKPNLNKRDSTEVQGVKMESTSRMEDGVLQLSEVMLAHGSVLDVVTGDQDRAHDSEEDPSTKRSNCESFCTTAIPESKTMHKTYGDLVVGTNIQSFGGFMTASNNKIPISEESLRKGELVFKNEEFLPIISSTKLEIEDKNAFISKTKTAATMTYKGFQTASRKEIIVTDSEIAKGSLLFQGMDQEIFQKQSERCKVNTTPNMKSEREQLTSKIEPYSTRSLDEISHEEIKEKNKLTINSRVCKKTTVDNLVKGNKSVKENPVRIVRAASPETCTRNLPVFSNDVDSHSHDIFTESQKAEINELSSILENAGSQFDFTQVKKINLLGLDNENLQIAKSFSDSQKLNTSDVWKDVDFNDSFSTEEGNTKSNAFTVLSESDRKSDAETIVCDIANNIPEQDSFVKHSGGLARVKSGNITDEDLIKAIEIFGDLEEKRKEKNRNQVSNPPTFPITNNCSPAVLPVNIESDTRQTTIVQSTKQTKQNGFSGQNNKQENECKGDKNDVANSENKYASCSRSPTMPVGFATGKGKLININKASLAKARTMFNDILDADLYEGHGRTGAVHEPSNLLIETITNESSTSFAGKETLGATSDQPPVAFSKESKASTISGDDPFLKPKLLHMVEKGVNKESCLKKKNPMSTMSSFGTASRKRVHFSEESLKGVHNTFRKLDDQVAEQQATGNVLTDSAVNPGCFFNLQNKSVLVKESTVLFPQQGFSTANGKMINVSHKFLQKAQEIFADIDETTDSDVAQRNLSTMSKSNVSDVLDHRMKPGVSQVREIKPLGNPIAVGHISEALADIRNLDNVSNKEMSNETLREGEISSIISFSTAGGKSIHLSDDSMKKAQRIFTDIDDSFLSDQDKFGTLVNQNERQTTKFSLPPIGFSTAKGKTVAVSHGSLQKARQMFAEIDDNVARLTFQPNKTSSKNVDTLEPIQKLTSRAAEVKNLKPDLNQCSKDTFGRSLDKGENKSVCPPRQETSCRKMPFFSTASGNQVNLSSKALEKARQLFADLSDEVVDRSVRNDEVVDRSVRNDEVVDRSVRNDEVVDRSVRNDEVVDRTLPNDEVVEDRTLPSDEVVEDRTLPSDEVVEDRTLPNDEVVEDRTLPNDEVVEDGSILNNEPVYDRSRQGSVPSVAIIGNRDLDNQQSPTMQIGSAFITLPPVAFSTASGKTVTVSHDSLQKAKLLFSNTDNPLDAAVSSQSNATMKRDQYKERGGFSAVDLCLTNKRSSIEGKTSKKCSEGKTRNDLPEPVEESGPVPKMPCFSTAGGKSVSVSEESLKRAREIFSDVDDDHSSQHNATVDSRPANKSASAEKASLREKNIMPEPAEIKYSCKVPANSFGFSTASGRQVCVSEDALQKVKGFFEEFNTNDNLDCPNENQESRRMKTPNPSLNKHLKDSVTKPDHFQKNPAENNHGNKNTPAMSSDFLIGRCPLPGFVKHSTPLYGAGATNVYIASSHTPENDFEIEAEESAKAFMDDEDLTDGLLLCSDKLPNIRTGKRLRSDDGVQRGEPPIKRQLLPEFDRSLASESKSALRPLTSEPHEILKDRRKYFYKVSLQPISTDPASFSKGIKETPKSKPIPPSQLPPKLNVSRGFLGDRSAHDTADCRNDPNNMSRTVPASCVRPLKEDLNVSLCDQMVTSPKRDRDTAKDIIRKSCVEVGTMQKDESGTDLFDFIANICCARDMQEMRIRKKQRQRIKPQSGSLYQQKAASSDRISLVKAVQGRQPTKYTSAELYKRGVLKNHIGINSEKAKTFEFHCLEYFTRESFLSAGGVQIADGGWLVPTDKLTAGREEFYRALCDTPGVDPKLISPEWVNNHYRWVVWKLAAMEVMFPDIFACRCLTPDRVLLQLKYRYDVEIDKCRRSAVRKIMERDDSPAKTLVLCISKILTLENCETSDVRQTSAVIEVTDGWYGIKAILDPALASLLKKGRMFLGQKIMVQGAELVGSEDACSPLEAPESLMLKIAGNSTRPARWHARLGYFHDPRPFCLRLSSLLAEGGVVGCVDVLIQRIYPMQWMEKMCNGTYVFRNERAEVKEAERHSAKQQKNLEVLFVKIQEDFEKQEVCAVKKRPRRQTLSEPQIRALQDGSELYEALQNEPDPNYFELCLSSEQQRALNHQRQILNDKRQAQIQAEFRKAMESSEQEAGSGARRDVTPVLKLRIVDYKDDGDNSAYMLNIWRPLPDVVSLLKEGGRFKIYQLAASQSKGRSDTAAVQLTATKKTQFQELPPLQDILEQIYTVRQVTEFSQFVEPHFTATYGEVDVVGLVICTQLKPGAAPLVYLSDENSNLVALKFYTDLGQLALEESTRPCTFIAAANLRWRAEYMSGVPALFAGDLSFIAANPKEHHLQRGIQKLRQSIQSVPEFCKETEKKLINILQTHNPQERSSFTRCSLDPRSHVGPGSRGSTPLNNPHVKYMSTPDSKTIILSTSNDMDPKTCKMMKGLDYLSRIPSPAPLTPMGTLLSPSLQRAFRPPRSFPKDDRTCATTSGNIAACTPSKVGGFVADEELAMINTQALVFGLGGGRKPTVEQESSTSDIQKKKIPNIQCPTKEEASKTQEMSQAPYQTRLCRKRKQKP
ncbi:breast cancer type 2 susceptibility protein [Anomaloglossus baeobatrachus]|uniref:breast cancer type 2 susceptibility protein n=1 Tax=Anomaloglossus baeobatrachus TaxID=238106 RepID=UPI003F503128